jgi:hypothetical protein
MRFVICTAHKFHYCCSEVHAEDNVPTSEIQPNSSIADVQSGSTGLKYVPSIADENSTSDLLGTLL